MAGLLEDIDPAVFQAVEGFDVVVGVGELNLAGFHQGRLSSVTRLFGSGRSSVVSHQGTA